MNKTLRVDKYLANSGFMSRKEIREIVKSGRVKVNDKVISDPGTHVKLSIDNVYLDDELIKYKKYIYIMLNKPKNVITATFDNKHKTVLDILPEEYKKFNLSPVGRLDIDTEGLLLLTNDGDLNHNLLSPKKHVYKTYYTLLEKPISINDIEQFEKGVRLDDGYVTMPAKLYEAQSEDKESNCVFVEIKEGKFHQVKRMFEAIGNKVLYLKRVKMGTLVLDEKLLPGQYRELSNYEEMTLMESVK